MAEALFWIAVVACAVAQLALLRSAFRAPNGSDALPAASPRRGSEIAWALVPAVMLALVLALTWRKMQEPPSHQHHAPVASASSIQS